MGFSNKVWDLLEQWSAIIFLVAGVLLLITAVGLAVEVVTDMSLQGPLIGIPQFLGLLIAYVGLLGIYPHLRDHAPQLALVGILLILAPIAAIILILAYSVAVGGEPPFAGLAFMVIGLGFALGIGMFGLASIQTEIPSRGVGLFLLMWAVPWLLLVALGAENSAVVDFVISMLNAVAVLGIGYLLQTKSVTTDPGEPTATSTP